LQTRTVSDDEVLFIHNTLVADFQDSADPISPSGVRSIALLQSAVGRQHTGLGATMKYPNPVDNAATLLYGLCNDHPFHNGNKRTALVATLVHLDKNKLTTFGTSQNELYDLMLLVASRTISKRRRRRRSRGPQTPDPDDEVKAIATWLNLRVAAVTRGERQITYRELKRILDNFGFKLENPNSSMIEVVRYVSVKRGFFVTRYEIERQRLGKIGWPGDNRDIGVGDIKKLRRMCKLCEEDGVDSDSFYFQEAMVDAFVNRYRTVLRRLART